MAELPSSYGPYQIVNPLGAGGMGQVYRARDTRLQRFVAIKVLHDSVTPDPDRRRRFAEEAVAASALNHPNILTVYDVGADGEIQYLVSELIEGESLRTQMNRGRVPLKRVIEIAHQIAEGLAAAHAAGIVHRDLKPENVMVTADGHVKIVDFGLARAADADAALATRIGATQTAEGLIVGTVPYMSPEQARGEPADFRSDQFALGVMLYELTTAAHPFKRETAVQTLSAIIAEDPPDPAQIAPALPVVVRWLIRRLLAKNPRQRYAHTADLAADLRTIRENLSEATIASGVTTAVTIPRPRWQMMAIAAALAGAAVLIVPSMLVPADAAARFDRFIPFAADLGYQSAPVWSPDGNEIAYEGEINGVVQIFTRKLGSAVSTQITHERFDCFNPMWAADGFIYYHALARTRDALWRISPVGGSPDLILEGASRSALSPDGKTLFFIRDEGAGLFNFSFWSATLPDGKEERYTRGALKDWIGSSAHMKFSPDGSRLLVWLGPGPTRGAGFYEIPTRGGEPKPVLPGIGRNSGLFPALFSWLPDNRHVVVTRSDGPTSGLHLWLADTRTEEVIPITTTPGNENWPALSKDGRALMFAWQTPDFDLFEVPLDGSPLKTFRSTSRNEFDPAVSPANTQFAYVTDRSGNPQIWLENLEGYLRQPIVTEADFGNVQSNSVGALAFSPDGSKLAFQRAATTAGEDGSRIWIVPLAGGKPVGIGGGGTFQDAATWSPDGAWIAYLDRMENEPGSLRLVKAPVGGSSTPVTLYDAGIPPFVARPQWSPDGGWILCETLEGLTLVDAKGTRSPRIIGDRGWFTYAWDKEGRRIHGLRTTDDVVNHFMLVSVDPANGQERVINASLGTIPQALQPIRGFSQLPNGSFLTSIARVRSDIYLIEGLQLPRTWWERFWRIGRR